MASLSNENQDLKNKIESVILESYKRTKDKNFQELNFVFPKNKSVIGYLKDKIKIFQNLDVYSQTFLSIYTRAKITLREFQTQEFDGSYLELLRLVLTLPDALGNGNLKSTKVTSKDEIDISMLSKYKVGENITNKEIVVIPSQTGKTNFVKMGVSGKKLNKQTKEKEFEFEELNNIDFEDEEYDNEKDNLDDIVL